jgi:hypothetical protein
MKIPHSYVPTVTMPRSASISLSLGGPFPDFINPINRTRNENQENPIKEPNSLCLKDPLQEGDVNHGHLPKQTATDGETEHAIIKKTHFASQ